MLLTEKNCETIRDFKKPLVTILWYSLIALWDLRLQEKFLSFNF